jgi:hypothetical protein
MLQNEEKTGIDQGPIPPPTLPGFFGTMSPSDFHNGPRLIVSDHPSWWSGCARRRDDNRQLVKVKGLERGETCRQCDSNWARSSAVSAQSPAEASQGCDPGWRVNGPGMETVRPEVREARTGQPKTCPPQRQVRISVAGSRTPRAGIRPEVRASRSLGRTFRSQVRTGPTAVRPLRTAVRALCTSGRTGRSPVRTVCTSWGTVCTSWGIVCTSGRHSRTSGRVVGTAERTAGTSGWMVQSLVRIAPKSVRMVRPRGALARSALLKRQEHHLITGLRLTAAYRPPSSFSRAAGSTGLVRCRSNPASWDRAWSSSCPYPVRAMRRRARSSGSARTARATA